MDREEGGREMSRGGDKRRNGRLTSSFTLWLLTTTGPRRKLKTAAKNEPEEGQYKSDPFGSVVDEAVERAVKDERRSISIEAGGSGDKHYQPLILGPQAYRDPAIWSADARLLSR
jgi:hypothetical protein